MRCKDMKAEIKRLNALNRTLKEENVVLHGFDEHVIDFNLLEIVVRPRRRFDRLYRYEMPDVDLRVQGTDKVPTICNYKRIEMSALEVLMENKQSFIRYIGEIMAAELLRKGEEVLR